MAVVVTHCLAASTVLDASYGPDGYIESFDATFEQHARETYLRTPRRGSDRQYHAPTATTTVQVTVDAAGELAAHGR